MFPALSNSKNNSKVEISLANNLDESRGFCIDIRGYKHKAKIEKGLQAHTCYSYQGELAVDQAFESSKLKEGIFYISKFSSCMSAVNLKKKLTLKLQTCNESINQVFKFKKDKTIRPQINKNFCITVSQNNSIKGGGGRPVHLKRKLYLSKCDINLNDYQNWIAR